MTQFRFLHAADLHIDSPLTGLTKKSRQLAQRIGDASRDAFDNLISLAIDEDCRFVLLAGDIFDGHWRDYRTGLFFIDRMRRLREKGIGVYMILGNHDAENRFVSRLELVDNVHLFPNDQAGQATIQDLDVVIHGRSFPQRAVTENLAAAYGKPVPGAFNIGLLHTACGGRDGHEPYAPCTLEQLVSHGYDYWALGHIHQREVLHEHPHVVFPGNLQGRHARETGSKGASLVSVDNRRISDLSHCALDTVRWLHEDIDVSLSADLDAVHHCVRRHVAGCLDDAAGRSLVIRISLSGRTALHTELITRRHHLREDIETLLAGMSDDIILEKLEVATQPPMSALSAESGNAAFVDPTMAGRVSQAIMALGGDAWMTSTLEARLKEISAKLPASASSPALLRQIGDDSVQRAMHLALSVLEQGDR
jgi:DNA repair protein SbcD/Mre11